MPLANIERTGQRKLTKLSGVARKVDRVRHYDVDLFQACALCHRPQAFCEVKSTLVPDAYWKQMRLHADKWGHGCVALLVVEAPSGEIGIKRYDGTIGALVWGDEDMLRKVLEQARDQHECW